MLRGQRDARVAHLRARLRVFQGFEGGRARRAGWAAAPRGGRTSMATSTRRSCSRSCRSARAMWPGYHCAGRGVGRAPRMGEHAGAGAE